MDKIWPQPKKSTDSEIDSAQLYELEQYQFAKAQTAGRPGQPWVVVNMISSLDGSATSQGRSSGMGNKHDRLVFNALRAGADFILAGANTIRQENYGAPKLSSEVIERRIARGQKPVPQLVTLSKSLSFGGGADDSGLGKSGARFLSIANEAPELLPIIYTVSADTFSKSANSSGENEELEKLKIKREELKGKAEIRTIKPDQTKPSQILQELLKELLKDLGKAGDMVLVEGGSNLNGQLAEAGLIDELHLSFAPLLMGGDGMRILTSTSEISMPMKLARVLVDEDGILYLRYLNT